MSKSSTSNRLFTRRLTKRLFDICLPFVSAPIILLGCFFYSHWRKGGFSSSDFFLSSTLLIFAALFIIYGLSAWLISWRIAIPISKLAAAMHSILSGDLDERVDAKMKFGLPELSAIFNQFADEYRSIYQSLNLVEHSSPNHALTKVVEAVISSHNSSNLLPKALELIAHSFSCSFAGIYLPEKSTKDHDSPLALQYAFQSSVFGDTNLEHEHTAKRINKEAASKLDSLALQALTTGKTLASEISADPGIIGTAIPMLYQGYLAGVLSVCIPTTGSEPPSIQLAPHFLPELEKIAKFLAIFGKDFSNRTAPLGKSNLLKDREDSFEGSAIPLYRASSKISRSDTVEDAVSALLQALRQTPYPAAILLTAELNNIDTLQVFFSFEDKNLSSVNGEPILLDAIQVGDIFKPAVPLQISDMASPSLPSPLIEILSQMGCNSAIFLPVMRDDRLRAMLILSQPSSQNGSICLPTLEKIDPWYNLIEALAESLEKIRARAASHRQIAELQAIRQSSQAISIETDLGSLFQTIHRQVELVMGELNSFAIALYDAQAGMLLIPYLFEEKQMLEIAPFPLGEGLTSILVQTQRPLLLDEDVETKAMALGAKIQGKPAKSWLGVPMLCSGEVVGAMILQDVQRAKRFGQEDVRLLSALAAQTGVVVRNARLLERMRRKADRERQLNEITARIHHIPDIQTILKTTATELGSALNAQRAHICIELKQENLQQLEGSG